MFIHIILAVHTEFFGSLYDVAKEVARKDFPRNVFIYKCVKEIFICFVYFLWCFSIQVYWLSLGVYNNGF